MMLTISAINKIRYTFSRYAELGIDLTRHGPTVLDEVTGIRRPMTETETVLVARLLIEVKYPGIDSTNGGF